jgi:hypothetical protein
MEANKMERLMNMPAVWKKHIMITLFKDYTTDPHVHKLRIDLSKNFDLVFYNFYIAQMIYGLLIYEI